MAEMSNREYYRSLDLSTRFKTLRRDKHRCQVCQKRGVHVHEIIPRSRFGRTTMEVCFQLRNRLCLCNEHHEEAHTQEQRKLMLLLLEEKYGYDYSDEPFVKYYNW